MRTAVQPLPYERPTWRGLLHLISTPFALALGIVLVALAPSGQARVGAAFYMVGATAIFGCSAAYHRVNWSRERWRRIAKRADHATIFLGIAGTYTPLCLSVLQGSTRHIVLAVVWIGAAVGILVEMFLDNAPRLLVIPLYLALGWAAVFILGPLQRGAGVTALILLLVGGVLYSVGAVAYATRKPNPKPDVFGYHEVFHAFTVAAWACHGVAVSLAILG